jgi:hypothetical protein
VREPALHHSFLGRVLIFSSLLLKISPIGKVSVQAVAEAIKGTKPLVQLFQLSQTSTTKVGNGIEIDSTQVLLKHSMARNTGLKAQKTVIKRTRKVKI